VEIIEQQLNEKKSEKQRLIEQIKINNDKLHEVEILINNTKKTFFEIIIEVLTFRLISFAAKYNELIDKYKKEQLKLINNLKHLNGTLQNVIDSIKELESLFKKNILIFQKILEEFQKNLINLSNKQYINNYTQVELVEKLNKTIENKEKFLFHKKVKNNILVLIEFYNKPTKWVRQANKLFIQNEKISEKTFFDTIESNPLTNTQTTI